MKAEFCFGSEPGCEGIYFRFGRIGENRCALWLEHLVSLGIIQSYERLPPPLPDFRVTLPDGSEVMWDAKNTPTKTSRLK